MSYDQFLPTGYEPPKTGGNYMKLTQGENRFRIVSRPIIGWLDWNKDNKPLRFKQDNKPQPIDPNKPVRHFWAFVVINTTEKCIQILEVTQSSIQAQITALTRDPDWGSPFDYDIKITKSGVDKETKYTVNPAPKKPFDDEMNQLMISTYVRLEALFEGADPFAKGGDE